MPSRSGVGVAGDHVTTAAAGGRRSKSAAGDPDRGQRLAGSPSPSAGKPPHNRRHLVQRNADRAGGRGRLEVRRFPFHVGG